MKMATLITMVALIMTSQHSISGALVIYFPTELIRQNEYYSPSGEQVSSHHDPNQIIFPNDIAYNFNTDRWKEYEDRLKPNNKPINLWFTVDSTPKSVAETTTKTKEHSTTGNSQPWIVEDTTATEEGAYSTSESRRTEFVESTTSYIAPELVIIKSPSVDSSIKSSIKQTAEELDLTTTVSPQTINGSCKFVDDLRVCYAESGYCEEVYKEGPCVAGEWLVLSPEGRPHCQPRACGLGEFMFKSPKGNHCVTLEAVTCGKGKEPLLFGSGEIECVCPDGYSSQQGGCKKLQVCSENQHLAHNNNGQIVCSDNIMARAVISSTPEFHCPPPRYYRSPTGACKRKRYMSLYSYYKLKIFGRSRRDAHRTKCTV